MKKIGIIALLLLVPIPSKATHILGGEITWECTSNGQYIFSLVLYRDCCSSCATLPTTSQSIATNAGVTISAQFVSTYDIINGCGSNTISCGGTAASGAMQRYLYQSSPITLTGSPPSTGWWFMWNSCCRPPNVTNGLSNQSFMLRALMYPYTPAGSTSPLSAGTSSTPTCYDNSPSFLEAPNTMSCSNSKTTFTGNISIDSDFDSLYHDWAHPLTGGVYPGSNATFTKGYSYNSPFPSGTGSVPGTINHTSGAVEFTSAINGVFVSCFVTESWRDGQLIGKVYRDVPFYVISCAPGVGNCSSAYLNQTPHFVLESTDTTLPALHPVVGTNLDTTHYVVNAKVGDSISIRITASDSSLHPNCDWEKVYLCAYGLPLADSLGSCMLGGNCATVTRPPSTSPHSAYDEFILTWVIDSTHLTNQQGTIIPGVPNYGFAFKATDDQCPINRSSTALILVKVFDNVPTPPQWNPGCFISDSVWGNRISWTPTQDTGFAWGGYAVHAIDYNGTMTTLDTIWNWSTNTYTDTISSYGSIQSYVLSTFNSEKTHFRFGDTLSTILDLKLTWSGGVFSLPQGYVANWLSCDSSGSYTLLMGNATQTYTPIANGSYAAIISNGTCADTSRCMTISNVALSELDPLNVVLQPNPNSGQFDLVCTHSHNGLWVKIYALDGREVYNGYWSEGEELHSIALPDLARGTYVVRISSDQKVRHLQFEVL